MERENDPQQQKWGNLVGEEVNNLFRVGSLRRLDTDIESSNATLPRSGKEQLLMLWFCRLKNAKYSNYSNITAGSHVPISKQCRNASGSPRGCTECTVNYDIELWKPPCWKLICLCNVTTSSDISDEDCCHHACCKEMAVRCYKSSNPDSCNSSELAIIVNLMLPTRCTCDIPHSTTAPHSGSTPTRRRQDLALVAAAILIYIYISYSMNGSSDRC